MILITNDDGYSNGVEILLKAAKKIDETYAIIPAKQRSAIGKAITLHKPLRFREFDKDIYTLTGTPADCVEFALFSEEVPTPDIIFSGINIGDNTTLHAFFSSGTLGACIEAALFEKPAIAFSFYKEKKGWIKERDWPSERIFVKKIIEAYNKIKDRFKKDRIFSINFPNRLKEETKIIKAKKVQRHRYEVRIEKRIDPAERPYYWTWGPQKNPEPGTDLYEVAVNKNIVISEFSINTFIGEEKE